MADPPPPPPLPAAAQTLFTVPIDPLPPHHPGGTITATSPHPQVYLLTITSPPDNRLTAPMCRALLRALDEVEASYPPGVVVTTSGVTKFYSNGLDLAHARAGGAAFFTGALYPLFRRLVTYPMPTVALMPGHAFAAGLMLAMHHDYRVANPQRGYLCLNELDFGAPLKAAMSAVFRVKTCPAAYRALVLEARRFAGPAARDEGLVDALGGLDAALALIDDRRLVEKGRTGIYGIMKADMYREVVGFLEDESYHREEEREARAVREAVGGKTSARRRIEEAEGRSKL